MDLKQALAILADVCSKYRGTLAEHNTLQTALAVVAQEIELKRNLVPVPPAAPADPIKPE
jgi:hypothetical protein